MLSTAGIDILSIHSTAGIDILSYNIISTAGIDILSSTAGIDIHYILLH